MGYKDNWNFVKEIYNEQLRKTINNKEEWKNGKPFCHYWGNWIFTAIYLDDASDYDIIGIKEIK